MTELRKYPYKGTFDIFARYWRGYGGWSSIFKSFYLHVALIITILMYAIWSQPGWWDISLNILPNLVGFTLGGYAMLLSFGGERFQNILIKAKVGNVSAFVEVSATFTHFIVVQFIGLLCALLAKGTFVEPPKFIRHFCEKLGTMVDLLRLGFWFFGVFLLIYALTTGVAATMRIYRLSENVVMAKPPEPTSPPPPSDTYSV